jgi:hypothetical protein
MSPRHFGWRTATCFANGIASRVPPAYNSQPVYESATLRSDSPARAPAADIQHGNHPPEQFGRLDATFSNSVLCHCVTSGCVDSPAIVAKRYTICGADNSKEHCDRECSTRILDFCRQGADCIEARVLPDNGHEEDTVIGRSGVGWIFREDPVGRYVARRENEEHHERRENGKGKRKGHPPDRVESVQVPEENDRVREENGQKPPEFPVYRGDRRRQESHTRTG